jgi:hypothetical protein
LGIQPSGAGLDTTLCHQLGSMPNIQKKSCHTNPSLKLIGILIPDTVEAYESGELAKLLGIDVEDEQEL